MMLSQLWVLNHLALGRGVEEGGLSDIQRHPQWDSVVSLPLLKYLVLLGCFHTTGRSDSLSCVHLPRTVWSELGVTLWLRHTFVTNQLFSQEEKL